MALPTVVNQQAPDPVTEATVAQSPDHYNVTHADGTTTRLTIRYHRPFSALVRVTRCVICDRVNTILGDSDDA
jgi:hypothetical protein